MNLPVSRAVKTSLTCFGLSFGFALLLAGCGGAPDGALATDDESALTGSGGGTSDGTPQRQPCTNDLGSGLTGTFGRLDGVIAAVVPPGRGSCNADEHHVHLQVLSAGQIYDVAVNIDGGFIATKDVPLPKGAWADGWHAGGQLDYVTDLGLHDADFQTGSESALDQQIEAALANANHVSVFATLYSHSGVHEVHRHGQGNDGLLVLDPLSPDAHAFAFHFSNQSF
jgi:hypothetical protein